MPMFARASATRKGHCLAVTEVTEVLRKESDLAKMVMTFYYLHGLDDAEIGGRLGVQAHEITSIRRLFRQKVQPKPAAATAA